ncbi:hypothetical protein ACFV0T_35575 [Streptomyces sp. NPDC059582]|uniref:hypothetical protein n=1 Tax=Streptomyces sp. NPDC059582 TaxID=3346875 RepID=UPI0036D12CEE
MRNATAGIAAVLAATLLTRCSTSDSSNAATEKVLGVCEDLGVQPDGTGTWNDGSSAGWAGMARLQNNVANQAASAAVTDPRWNRLADALGDVASIAQRYAHATPAPSELTAEDSTTVSESGVIVPAECRKVFAAA